ncbi:MAG: PH domain-containing protein [Bifidobacteriaceae bacterium]|nr:PH domain-containing protein [Bifidobacteriaceae bacterium]
MAAATFTYRPRTGPAVAIGTWALATWTGVSLAGTDGEEFFRWLPALAWAALTVWAVFWAPKVTVSPGGLVIRNVTASHWVPWAAIARVDTKWALTLYTGRSKVTAFAAPASLRPLRGTPGGDLKHLPESTFDAGRSVRPGDLPGTPSGDLAWVVRERWERARDAGPTGVASGEVPTRCWHWGVIGAWVALAAVAALARLTA